MVLDGAVLLLLVFIGMGTLRDGEGVVSRDRMVVSFDGDGVLCPHRGRLLCSMVGPRRRGRTGREPVTEKEKVCQS